MDIRAYNRDAWNREVEGGSQWTIPVDPDTIARARDGDWAIHLTADRTVPRDWFPPLVDCDVLCLAGSGGQQGPVLAAAGARVTVLDNSPAQLDRDREVADREGLALTLLEGDMADLSELADGAFDLVFNPVSCCFVPDVLPVWREAHRVLRPGGTFLSGHMNPVYYVFDTDALERGELVVRHTLPHADVEALEADELRAHLDAGHPLEYGHTLDQLIGGMLAAGFVLADFFEDRFPPGTVDPVGDHMPVMFAARMIRNPVS